MLLFTAVSDMGHNKLVVMDKRDVMLSEERLAEVFAVPLATLRSYRKTRRGPRGPKAVETSRGLRYPLTEAHTWYRERWLPSLMRQKIEAVEAEEAEALDHVRV